MCVCEKARCSRLASRRLVAPLAFQAFFLFRPEAFAGASGLKKAGRVPVTVKHAAAQRSRATKLRGEKDPKGENRFFSWNKGFIVLPFVPRSVVSKTAGVWKTRRARRGNGSSRDSDF